MKVFVGVKAYKTGTDLYWREINLSIEDFHKLEKMNSSEVLNAYLQGPMYANVGYPTFEIIEIEKESTGEKIRLGTLVLAKDKFGNVHNANVNEIMGYDKVSLCSNHNYNLLGEFSVEEISIC